MPELIEGKLDIQLIPGERRNDVCISSSRPVTASQLFVGKPVDSALQRIPLLFNVCGNAQLIAAVRAIESNLETPVPDAAEEWREALLELERLREQLWRILLEWPRLSDYNPDTTALARFNQELNALIKQLRNDPDITGTCPRAPRSRIDASRWSSLGSAIEQAVFAGQAREWLEQTGICSLEEWCDRQRSMPADLIRDIFDRRWHSLGFSDYQPLKQELDAEVRERLLSGDVEEFIRQPTLKGFCLETGPLARHDEHPLIEDLLGLYGNGLLSRLAARLVDIADSLVRLDDFFTRDGKLAYEQASDGIATVEAARGRLTHRVSLENDSIAEYWILAPTEWNFHPAGVVARGLASLVSTNPVLLRRQAAMLIHAVDPCVGYALSIR
ncbi:MAG: nickel-dependent hydrogenase large subunit [Gammaproteobacteria bacterium]